MAEPSAKRRKVRDPTRSHPPRGPAITDPRFANIQSDPRYRLPSKGDTHVKLDNRFSRILKDEDFVGKARVDRYGRQVDHDATRRRLKSWYKLEDDNRSNDDNSQFPRESSQIAKAYDPLRDGALSASSSSDDGSSEEEDDAETHSDIFLLGDSQGSNIPVGDISSRLAVVNLDWDNIRAEDLMAVFSSFLPPAGSVVKVSIYTSEFGRERMEREEVEGPPKEIFAAVNPDASESGLDQDLRQEDEKIESSILEPDAGAEFDSAQLRHYQLERLRYFYAVLTFSSPFAAKAVYDAVDGAEYLSTANFFDLRFVPEDTDFTNDKAREECDQIPVDYRPSEFVTDALQHSRVKLTWDAEDVSRKEAQARAFGGSRREMDENDLKAYLGSDTSEEGKEEEESGTLARPASRKEDERQKMRALLGLGAESVQQFKKDDGPIGDVQITFSSGLIDPDGLTPSILGNGPVIEESTVEKYVRKERERKQKRKDKLKTARDATRGSIDGMVEAAAMNGPARETADLGFADPFFAAADNDKLSTSKVKKAQRVKMRAEKEAEEVEARAQRAELELLMLGDGNVELNHFDMKEIEKAEKKAKKKGKKFRTKQQQADGGAMVEVDDFKMDTHDPRFARLYDNHEFAIDPTNPRFKATGGMKALLDEARKRRKEVAMDADDDHVATEPRPLRSNNAMADREDSQKVRRRREA